MPQEDDDLAANYVGAFDGRLSFGKRPALLIVDFVMAYLDKSSPLYAHVEDALESNIRLLAAARAAGIPVIFTNVVYEKDGADGGYFYPVEYVNLVQRQQTWQGQQQQRQQQLQERGFS